MRRVILSMIVVGAIVCAAVAGTTRANAALLPNCGTTSPVFKPWSDSSGYYFAANGGFENQATGWTLAGGASVVSGNDPYKLSGAGSHALLLKTGASASISVCYGLTYPAVRFVAAGAGGSAVIHVRIISRSLLGVLSTLDGGTFTVPAGWNAAPKLSTLFSALTAPLASKSMTIQISVDSGSAYIDDLFVDPLFTKA
ncbi:MAG: hypothetical protein ACTHKS_13545 [Gaiellaceae bacterium]